MAVLPWRMTGKVALRPGLLRDVAFQRTVDILEAQQVIVMPRAPDRVEFRSPLKDKLWNLSFSRSDFDLFDRGQISIDTEKSGQHLRYELHFLAMPTLLLVLAATSGLLGWIGHSLSGGLFLVLVWGVLYCGTVLAAAIKMRQLLRQISDGA